MASADVTKRSPPVEGHPDAMITLTNGTKLVVAEAAEEVVAVVGRWRVDIMAEAIRAT
jgi:uncharacterized protein YlzI (FlbEa/FlbD family)